MQENILLPRHRKVYNEKCKTLEAETEEHTRCKDHPDFGRIILVEMVNLPEAIYRFNAEAIKIPWQFFTDRK